MEKIKYIEIEAGVRYWEDAYYNEEQDDDFGSLAVCKEGGLWKPIIDIEKGQIINWEKGIVADIHYKVVDQFQLWLLDEDKHRIKKQISSYVPNFLSDFEDSDYIILKINEDGFINSFSFSYNEDKYTEKEI